MMLYGVDDAAIVQQFIVQALSETIPEQLDRGELSYGISAIVMMHHRARIGCSIRVAHRNSDTLLTNV